MAEAAPADDIATWQRKTAMRCNNRAWELSVKPRTHAEDREMLDAAHAAAFHWGEIGTELNRMRASMLLAEVHALLGNGALALRIAEPMRLYFLAKNDTPDWEKAFTHAVHAHAAHAAGDASAHRASYGRAQEALAAIADPGDRKVVAETLANVPAP
jgi:hypothetical protein